MTLLRGNKMDPRVAMMMYESHGTTIVENISRQTIEPRLNLEIIDETPSVDRLLFLKLFTRKTYGVIYRVYSGVKNTTKTPKKSPIPSGD